MRTIQCPLVAVFFSIFALFAPIDGAKAATAAGAGIELNGKYIGGYVITRAKETRADLVGQLVVRHLTFERDFKLPVDPKKPNTVTLAGEIKIYSKIRGDREVEARASELKLVKRKGEWYVERNSLRRALNLPEKPETD